MDLKKTEGQGHEHLCHTSLPVRNGHHGSDRTTTTKAATVRKQLGPKNSKSNEGTRGRKSFFPNHVAAAFPVRITG